MAWVLDHGRDLEADFLAFYHLAPGQALARLTGPQYLALAWRVGAYGGVMAARLEAQQDRTAPRREADRVEGTRAAIQSDPVLSDMIDFG